MADEMVDVINESDEILRQELKSDCHTKGYWHRIASVYLFDSKGKLWLQKRAKKKTGAGRFDSTAAGHVGVGESYEEAAYKEMGEEIGIKTPIKLFASGLKENVDDEGIKIRHISSAFKGFHDGPFTLQEEELESIAAYEIEDIKKMIAENPEKFTKGLLIELEELFKIL